jgi:GDP-D-mannose 3',5'-epimerase
MGFISVAECEVLRNNALINIHMTHTAAEMGVPRYFFSSSVCVYRDMQPDEPPLTEDDAIPAHPDNEYGWEKLYAEHVAQAYGRRYGMKARIARFENCYGPEGTWTGRREKAPAAICRKVAEAEDGGTIEVWGDGTAIRVYTYVDDLCRAILLALESDGEVFQVATGAETSIIELAEMVRQVVERDVEAEHGPSRQGDIRRNYSAIAKVREMLGWEPRMNLIQGLRKTWGWFQPMMQMAGSENPWVVVKK